MDAAFIVGCLYVVNAHMDNDPGPALAWAAVSAVALFLAMGEVMRLYGSWRLSSLDEEFKTVLIVWAVVCMTLIVGAFLAKVSATYSRVATIAWFLTTPALLLSARLAVRTLLRWARRHGANRRLLAIAGAGPLAEQIAKEMASSEEFGMHVVGVFDDRGKERIESLGHSAARYTGTLSDMVDKARGGLLDYVVIALPMRAERRIIQLVDRLADTTATVYVIPDVFLFDLMRAQWTQIGALPAVSVYDSPFDGFNGWLKRAEDVVLGLLLLIVTAIPMLLIALRIKRSSAGPVLFRQKRYGLNGRVVEVLKFRTMTTLEDGAQVTQATVNDDRVTPFGRFLRTTSLDELPQLFNVIMGEMSLVGPRPHAVAHNEEYRRMIRGYMLRHKVKPGITGWAQINGWRGETDSVGKMKTRIDHDLEYVQRWSLWLDVKILVRTIAVVLSKKNAY